MIKRGWCPTLDRPMASGDGLLVRVQPRRARMTPAVAHALADAASSFGNGIIELTQRGNLQLRGLSEATLPGFAAAMDRAGLPSPGPLLPPPLLGDDPGIDPRATALLARLEHAVATDPRLSALPAKFAIAIEAGGVLGGRPVAADLVAHMDGTLAPPTPGVPPAPVGPLPYGDGAAAFGLAPPFGQLDAAMLHQAADLAARHGTTLRVTPWRALLLGRVTARIEAGPAWITDPADPRLLVTACIGAPGCRSGTVPARADAARLRPTHPVHVSGCAKGCAHPAPAALTLVGRDGRYDVVRNGRASDAPVATGLTFTEASA